MAKNKKNGGVVDTLKAVATEVKEAAAKENPKVEEPKKAKGRKRSLPRRGYSVTFGGDTYLVTDDREESYSGINLATGKLTALDAKKIARNSLTHSEFAEAVLSDTFKGDGLPSGSVAKMRNILNGDDASLDAKCVEIGRNLWGSWPVKPGTGKYVTAKR